MSWWDIGEGRVIGDGPADVMTLALASVASERAESGRPRPSLESVLSGMAAAMATGDDQPPRLVASRISGNEIIASGTSGQDVAIAFREALAEIERQYEERWERRPDDGELLETLLFVLMGAADSYLRDGEGLELHGIKAQR